MLIFLFNDMIDANANIKIDTKTLKSQGTANIRKFLVQDDKK